jgi:hypothetical protein
MAYGTHEETMEEIPPISTTRRTKTPVADKI